MKYYAAIDTNVLVSAMLKWDSIPGNVMELAFSGMIVPLLNGHIMKEYRDVLSRPKFHLTDEIVQNILDEIGQRGIFMDAAEIDTALPDPKDIVFYAVVMEGRKTEDAFLVTGNIRHFPEKPYVVTPRQMMDIILKGMGDKATGH